MRTRNALVILALLLAAGCKTRNENSALPIVGIIPPTATASGGTGGVPAQVTCVFNPDSTEFTPFLPYNPAENRGMIAAVVENNATDPTALNPLLRTNSTSFLPHQAVVSYEFIPAGAGAAPPQQVIPTGGVVVPSGGARTSVGVSIFSGLNISVPAGTYIRVTMHLEWKLLDGSLVNSAEREYLFQFCTTPGCGLGGSWAAVVGTTLVSCY